MPTENPEDNKVYCKAYYQRLKADPEKWAAYLAKKAAARKKKPVEQSKKPVARKPRPVEQPVEQDPAPVAQPVEQPVGRFAEIGRKWREEEIPETNKNPNWPKEAPVEQKPVVTEPVEPPETSPVEQELKFVPEGEIDPEDLKGLFD